jgi:hypothetical protein
MKSKFWVSTTNGGVRRDIVLVEYQNLYQSREMQEHSEAVSAILLHFCEGTLSTTTKISALFKCDQRARMTTSSRDARYYSIQHKKRNECKDVEAIELFQFLIVHTYIFSR